MSNNEAIQKVLDKHELTITSVFVPWSKSRNAAEKDPSLNWKVTLKMGNREIVTTDYMAGMGHCPAYKKIKNHMRLTVDDMQLINYECEKGKIAGGYMVSISSVMPPTDPKKRGDILPDAKDVICSLLMDAEVLEYPEYEEWAASYGYDEDSRTGEKIYRECLKIALKFRTIGESTIAELREVYQDY